MFEDDFEQLFLDIKDKLMLPRSSAQNSQTSRQVSTVLVPRVRLLMVLHWLRTNAYFRDLSLVYHINKGTISREIKHVIPKLFVHLQSKNLIQWPTVWKPHPFESVVGAIDGGCHYRNRVHPRQGDWYRGDKHAHFVSSQVVVSLEGRILHVALGLGHNNDKGMFNLTGMKEFLLQNGIRLLADRGYSHITLVIPDDLNGKEWNNAQKGLRSIAEVVIGLAKNWAVAGGKFRQGPEFHELCLMVVYNLLQQNLSTYPLRQPGVPSIRW